MIEARERGLLPPIRGSEGIAFNGDVLEQVLINRTTLERLYAQL